MQHCNDHSQTVTYNRKSEQRTNNIYFSILWDLEILGRPSWESTQLASIGKGSLNVPYKVWLIPCHCIMRKVMQCHLSLWCVMYLYVMGQFYLQYSSMIPLVRYGFYLLLIIFFLKKKKNWNSWVVKKGMTAWVFLVQQIVFLRTVLRITLSLTANFQSDALCGLPSFVQFKKSEKHPWRSITFSKESLQLY